MAEGITRNFYFQRLTGCFFTDLPHYKWHNMNLRAFRSDVPEKTTLFDEQNDMLVTKSPKRWLFIMKYAEYFCICLFSLQFRATSTSMYNLKRIAKTRNQLCRERSYVTKKPWRHQVAHFIGYILIYKFPTILISARCRIVDQPFYKIDKNDYSA